MISLPAAAGVVQFVHIGGEEDHCGQTGGADGIALGDGLGGVADRIQRIGDGADRFVQFGHFGDAAGVVGDRAVGVHGNDDTGQGQHGNGGDGDAVDAGALEGNDDAGGDDDHRSGGGLHGDTQAGDDVGAVAGGGGLGDMLDRTVFGGGVVFGDPEDGAGYDQTDNGGDEDVHGAEVCPVGIGQPCREHLDGDEVEGDAGQHAGNDQALVEGGHDLAGCAPSLTKKVPMMEAMMEMPPRISG